MELPDFRSEPINQKVYAYLKEGIVRGVYPPGQVMRETALALELGVSRTPVRDALRRLERDRLVVPSGPSFRVYRPTAQDVDELYECRTALEVLAAQLACRRGRVREHDEMERCLAGMEEAYRRGDASAVRELDTRFHDLLVAAAGSRTLAELMEHIHYRIAQLRNMARDLRLDGATVLDQHRRILEAVRAGNALAAGNVVREHLEMVREALLRRIREQGG